MNSVNRKVVAIIEKVARNVVEKEKKGASFCSVFWHQPKRPQRK